MNQRKGGWGAPTGRLAADHSLCANLTAPEHGTIECDQATCALVCDPGAIANGRRRTKCRFSETKGHFWKKALGTCHTCNELVALEFLETHCFFDGKGRKKCSLFCPWNQDMILDGEILVQKNRFKTTCRCPRPNKRECSWKGQEKIDTLTCVETPTTTGASTTFSAFPFNPEGGN